MEGRPVYLTAGRAKVGAALKVQTELSVISYNYATGAQLWFLKNAMTKKAQRGIHKPRKQLFPWLETSERVVWNILPFFFQEESHTA